MPSVHGTIRLVGYFRYSGMHMNGQCHFEPNYRSPLSVPRNKDKIRNHN